MRSYPSWLLGAVNGRVLGLSASGSGIIGGRRVHSRNKGVENRGMTVIQI